MNRQTVIERAVEKLYESLEAEYSEARKDELGLLHNKIVDALTEVGASPQNTLLVLEILRQEILQDCLDKFFVKVTEPSKEVKLSEKAPVPIQPKKAKSGGSVS